MHEAFPRSDYYGPELATAQWVTWYNQERLHEALDYIPPVEHEAALRAGSNTASQPTPALATT